MRIHRYYRTESSDDELSLLLARSRLELSLRADSFVSDDSENDAHRSDDYEKCTEVEELLTVALAEWQ